MNRFIFLLCCLLPSMGLIAQLEAKEDLDFFSDLATRDAKFESSLTSIDIEDEEDFWVDQLRFEKQLQLQNPNGHQAYIKGKYIAYVSHLKECNHDHSQFYYRQASYYAVKDTISLEPEPRLTAENSIKPGFSQTQNSPE